MASDISDNNGIFNVLVIDDNELSRNLLIMYLSKIGIKMVSYAENGFVGYKFVSSNLKQFNLLIVDNLMPVMNGVEMTNQLRLLGYPFLIIGLTGNIADNDIKEFLEAGADYILMKPLSMKELTSLISFIEKNGFLSKTSTTKKLVLTSGNKFEWISLQ